MSKENTSGVFKSRELGRAYALQALFQLELNPTAQVPNWENEDFDDEQLAKLSSSDYKEAIDFARLLFDGVIDRKEEIDRKINAAFNTNRTVANTDPIDRCILRMATYEMFFIKTPKPVVISQAIELGYRFGDTGSRAFLNGVLDHIE